MHQLLKTMMAKVHRFQTLLALDPSHPCQRAVCELHIGLLMTLAADD